MPRESRGNGWPCPSLLLVCGFGPGTGTPRTDTVSAIAATTPQWKALFTATKEKLDNKNTHFLEKWNTWEGSLSPQRRRAWVSAVNYTPFRKKGRGGGHAALQKCLRDNTKTCCYQTINLNLQVAEAYTMTNRARNHIAMRDWSC